MEIATMKQVTFTYPGETNPALSDLTFTIEEGSFVLVCGKSGSGKSTLLRLFKQELAPVGKREGVTAVFGKPVGEEAPALCAAQVGFVMQHPETQIVTDTVWHELAFGLENIGLPNSVIRRRVAETTHFFGIGSWFEKSVHELSGGQKQVLNLAAVMAMQPKMIILDEPTAQLDPIAAKEFLSALFRVNQELGTTVIVSEHRLEDVLPLCNQVLYLEKGTLAFQGCAQEFAEQLMKTENIFSSALPAATQIAYIFGKPNHLPLHVRDGRQYLQSCRITAIPPSAPHSTPKAVKATASLSAKHIWYRYHKEDPFVLQNMSISFFSGRIHALVGANGSGKSTLLTLLSGAYKPNRGKIEVQSGKRIAMLAQDPKALFVCDSVLDDLMECSPKGSSRREIAVEMAQSLGLSHLLHRHPYDLSGGEMQKAALGKLLLLQPDILLLDEPTKGLDAFAKEEFASILTDLKKKGKTLVVVSHDLDFIAQFADDCSMLFQGEITCTDACKPFFEGNSFYTTGVNRVTRGLLPHCVTLEDVYQWRDGSK